MIENNLIVFIIIVLTCVVGYFLQSLSTSGAVAALIVGWSVFIGFGEKGLILLGAFFATSSVWSKYKSFDKKTIEEKLAKGATRDWRQVAANGGAAALFSIIHFFNQDLIWVISFAVCIASANSDTWASEIGP